MFSAAIDNSIQLGNPSNREQSLALDARQVAFLLNISVRSVWRLTSSGELPKPVAIGRSRRWLRSAIENHLMNEARRLGVSVNLNGGVSN